jgi:NAD(P)-dependent dehydrogenase (short-subunit alcohol dehydrogenase family)
MDIKGKLALVTGSAKRVGRGIVLALAAEGADVIVHYRSSRDAAERTAGEARQHGVQAVTMRADLADPVQIERLFGEIRSRFGRLDILINNAAVYDPTPIQTLTAEQWDRQMQTNVRGPALCTRHAAELMQGRGGVIVNLTDIAATRPRGDWHAYCASKAALLALTKSTAKALAGEKIRVNCVSPGVAAWPEDMDPLLKQKILRQIPLGRPGTPEDIAQAVLFLVKHDYVTGEELRIDGGWILK